MANYCIYKHTLLIDCPHKGWSYIGQTRRNAIKRWKNGKGYATQLFGKAVAKYGWDSFEHTILMDNIHSLDEANKLEQYFIKKYHTYINDPECRGYNLTPGGDGGDAAKSDYVRNKIRATKTMRQVICIETGQIYESVHEACAKVNTHVADCLAKRRNTASGYHWAYCEDLQTQKDLAEFKGKPAVSHKELGLSKRAQEVLCIETGEHFKTITHAIKKYGNSVRAVLSGRCELAYGFHWIFTADKNAFNKFKQYYLSGIKHLTQSAKRPVVCVETGEIFESTWQAVSKYGASIIPVLKQKPGHNTAYGFHWQYLDTEKLED